MAMKMEDVTGGKLGNTNYTMVEAKFNGRVVWPTAFTYVVTSVTVNYTGGVNYIKANGSNWAYLTGTVEKRSGSTVIETLYNQSLTPTLVSGTYSSYFYIEGTRIRANSLGTEETAIEYYVGVRGTYGTSGASSTVYTYLQRNQKTAYGSPIYGEKVYGATTDTGSPHDYYISSLSSSNGYTSSSSPCPASGGSTTVSYYAATHLQDTITPWTRTVTQYYTYTALDEPVASTTTETGSDPGVRTVNDTPAITRYSGDTNITISGNTVTIPNRGTNEGSARSTTFRAVNGDKSASITIYQQENAITGYAYTLSVKILVDEDIPGEGGLFGVAYVSQRATQYTSLVTTDPTDYSANVSLTNCTSDESSVSGTGTFYINVQQNSSTELSRSIGVTLSADGHTASDTANQEPLPIIVTPTAIIYPDVDTDGRVRVRLSMTQGQFPSGDVVISGMVYHYVLENQGSGTEETRPISGDITITQNGDAVRLGAAFTWLPGTSGEHWFSATNVSRIGLNNTTFTHENFDIMGL